MTTANAESRARHNRAYYEKNKELVKARNRANKRRNAEYISRLKSETPCTDCKVKYPSIVMDFDHTSTDKTDNVSRMAAIGVSIATLDREIAKCEIVCSNCHRLRTYKR